ncbi:DUF1048 domain-containing protein [Streptomyces sp. NPDC058257]|uniref:DUF1048 domain-containing protein n=1 Tax=Streptomyces sp. NPDC058257 TaxID=3346409 RepID=UPI0036F17D4A
MPEDEKSGFIAKVIGPKKRWRAYKARVKDLPESYRAAAEAIERYLMHFVPTDADSNASMFDDLADLFEQAAADATAIRELVGEDPVEFVDAFAQNYSQGGYVPDRARKQLTDAITQAANEDDGEDQAGR